MSVTLNDHALTTIAAIEEALGLTAGAQDDKVKRLINVASDAIAGYCNRAFQKDTVTDEKHIGTGGKILILDRWPLVSITSISYDGTDLSSAEYEIYDADVGQVYHKTGVWQWTAPAINNIAGDPYPGDERKLYAATYVGGYVLPNDGGERTLPYDLEQAAIDYTVWRWHQLGQDMSIQSEKYSRYSVTYGEVDDSGIPAAIRAVVDKYRRYF